MSLEQRRVEGDEFQEVTEDQIMKGLLENLIRILAFTEQDEKALKGFKERNNMISLSF